MARLFTTGIETGDLLDFDTVLNATAQTTMPHTGTYSMRAAAGQYGKILISPSPTDEVYVRCWAYLGAATSEPIRISTSDSYVNVRATANLPSALKLHVGGTLVATSSITTPANTWLMLEMYAKIANSGGVLTLKIDGAQVATFTGDTLSATSTVIESVTFYGAATVYTYFDDIAINDTSGAADNSWAGDGRVIAIKPNAAGDNTDFTPSAGNNYENVDEVPPDDDTTYNESSTDGHYDLFNLGACGLSNVDITGVDVKVTARKTVANGDQMRAKIKTGGSEFDGDDQDILTTYTRFVHTWRTNPDTAAAWTTGNLDALQAGYENRA